MKKLIVLTIALLLCLAAVPAAAASAQESIVCGDYKYTVRKDGTAAVTAYTGSDEALEIPSELDGLAVTLIAPYAFFQRSGLTSVTLPEGLTGIGYEAFSGCARLASVTLPGTLQVIGDLAFYECGSLTAVALPDSLETVGVNPFAKCNSLAEITVSPEHPALEVIDGALFLKGGEKLVCYPAGKAGSEWAVPEGTTEICGRAFYRCGLTSVVLPDSLTVIGESAFNYCWYLASVNFPAGLTVIENGAFMGCDRLTSLLLPEGLTTIGAQAFLDCRKLASVTIPDSVTGIGWDAFGMCSPDLVVTAGPGSHAEKYCQEYRLRCVPPEGE